jgi:hypothetical protein
VHTRDGAVSVAYPFSGTPTDDQVRLDDGRSVRAIVRRRCARHPAHDRSGRGDHVYRPVQRRPDPHRAPGCPVVVAAGRHCRAGGRHPRMRHRRRGRVPVCPLLRRCTERRGAASRDPRRDRRAGRSDHGARRRQLVFGPLLGRTIQAGTPLAELLETAVARLSTDTRRAYAKLGLPMFTSLADGHAPSGEELGDVTGLPADEVRILLAEFGGLERDENSRIIG